jgi:ADP-ribosyl-[dinitrogen reductase] hydrolase
MIDEKLDANNAKRFDEFDERKKYIPTDMYFHRLRGANDANHPLKTPWLVEYLTFRKLDDFENQSHPRSPDDKKTTAWSKIQLLGAEVDDKLDRARGALIGLALGDVLGVPLEFSARDSRTVSGIEGGGPFKLDPGMWTDDTSMACCLAYSLIKKGGFDAEHQMQSYCKWYQYGAYSPTGTCFDIGVATRTALEHFLKTGQPYAGSDDPRSAGNGSLMRLAPIPIFYADSFEECVECAASSSRTTHQAPEAIDACRYYAALIFGALNGVPKDILLDGLYSPIEGYWQRQPLSRAILEIARGSYKTKERHQIHSSGYVVHTMEAALWALHRNTNFRDGVLEAVNLGDDSDTVGAVYGQLAGAIYGETGLPIDWITRLHACQGFYHFAQDLLSARALKK